jgi:hypothetical protein
MNSAEWWEDVPQHEFGPHNAMPYSRRGKDR